MYSPHPSKGIMDQKAANSHANTIMEAAVLHCSLLPVGREKRVSMPQTKPLETAVRPWCLRQKQAVVCVLYPEADPSLEESVLHKI